MKHLEQGPQQVGSQKQSRRARRPKLHVGKKMHRSAVGGPGGQAAGDLLRRPRGQQHQPHETPRRPRLAGAAAESAGAIRMVNFE